MSTEPILDDNRLRQTPRITDRRSSLDRITYVAAACLVLLLAACSGEGNAAGADGTTGPAADAVRSDFRLATLDGSELGPPDFRDRVVLIDFWATWCVPCHAQAEVLAEVWDDVRGERVQFLAVDVGEEEGKVRGFVDRSPFPYPVLLDPDSRLADSLGVISLPTLMVVDRAGKVTYFEAGIISEEELRRLIAEAGA